MTHLLTLFFSLSAKDGIYIWRELIVEMMSLCDGHFETDCKKDEKAAFGYLKESKSMQIMGGQRGQCPLQSVGDED